MGIFDKFFGKVKTGSGYRRGGNVPLNRDESLRGGLEKMQHFKYGGLEGKNLSSQDAKKIADVLEPYLKHLPLGTTLSSSRKAAIRYKLWKMVEAGEISKYDFEDAKHILEKF